MTIFDAIIQGLVQGITEFLPVSSDGHLSLTQHFLGVTNDTSLLFTVLLHLGTVMAVIFVFYKTIWELIVEFFRVIGDIFRGKFSFKHMSQIRRMLIMIIVSLIPLIAFLPLRKQFTAWSTDADIIIEGICFLFTGVLLLLGYRAGRQNRGNRNMTAGKALVVGTFQGLAALPGVSRSGSTIASGLFLGLEKEYMVKFSFIMGLPAILAANVLEIGDAVNEKVQIEILPVLIGVIVAMVVGFVAIKLLNLLIKKDKLNIFAYYCLVLGVLVIIEGIYEKIAGQNIFQAFFK